MRGLRVLLGKHSLLGVLSVCLGLAMAWLAIAQTSSSYPPGTVDIESVHDLDDWFRAQQLKWLPLMPPADEPFLQTGHPQVLPFDPLSFPQECKAGLVGDIEHGVAVYDLYLMEDPTTREFVIFNVDLEEVCSVDAPAGYDSEAFAKAKYPDLYSGGYSATQIGWILELYDPSRVQIAVRLVPEEFFDAYLEGEERAATLSSLSFGGMVMMMGGTSTNELTVSAVGPESGLTNEVDVTVHLPSGFTNDVDIFTCDEEDYVGWSSDWALAATNLSTTGTNEVVWTDTDVTNETFRIYVAGNAELDSDGDGLPDAHELLLYQTDPDLKDTDGDGLDDDEELDEETDPTDYWDPGPLTINILFPSEGQVLP